MTVSFGVSVCAGCVGRLLFTAESKPVETEGTSKAGCAFGVSSDMLIDYNGQTKSLYT